jgi:hypothetical protein
MTKIRRTALAAAAVLCVGGALASPALAAAPTSVSIEAQQGGFFGYVHSSKQTCEYNRTVELHKRTGALVGSDLAQPNGPDSQWSINTGRSGRFYVTVAAKGHCAAATSQLVHSQD